MTDVELLKSAKVVIYVPAYNCAAVVESVLKRVPRIDNAVILVLDNCSSDGTSSVVRAAIESGELPLPTVLVRNEQNLGYSGSQKKAYAIVRDIPSVEWVIMVHGDGQYEPEMVRRMEPFMSTDADLVYGFRSKKETAEETPWTAYLVIKGLSLLESIVTGHFRKEWHSGFVMYRTRFLARINLEALTSTPHIDGNLLFVAGLIAAKVRSVPIYKRYKELTVFEGAARRQYVLDVFKLMWKFRFMKANEVLRHASGGQSAHEATTIADGYLSPRS